MCVRDEELADSAAMHDPSLFHNRPLTQALIPHGSVCGERRGCTMWPTERCERVWDLWCLKLDLKRGAGCCVAVSHMPTVITTTAGTCPLGKMFATAV